MLLVFPMHVCVDNSKYHIIPNISLFRSMLFDILDDDDVCMMRMFTLRVCVCVLCAGRVWCVVSRSRTTCLSLNLASSSSDAVRIHAPTVTSQCIMLTCNMLSMRGDMEENCLHM